MSKEYTKQDYVNFANNVQHPQMTPTRRKILQFIAKNHDNDDSRFAEFGRIARYCGVAKETAKNNVKKLVEMGLILDYQMQYKGSGFPHLLSLDLWGNGWKSKKLEGEDNAN